MTPAAALPVSPLDPAEAERRRLRLVVLAVLSAVAATVLQMRWLEATKAAIASVEGASRHAVSAVTLFRAAVSSMDFVSGLAAAAIVFSLAEAVRIALGAVRAGGSAGLAALVPRGAFSRALLLLALAFTYLRWHLAPGFVAGFDVDLHASTVALAAKEVSEGRYPAWTDAWYLGFPLLRYYGAAYYLPAAALAAATGDVRLGVKVVALLWHLAAVPAAYALAKETGATRGVSIVSAVAYAGCSFFGATLAATGSLTAAPVIALVPAALALAVRTGSPRGEWKHAAGLGLAMGLLLAAHPAYALPAGLLCAVAAATSAGRRLLSPTTLLRAVVALAVATLAALPVLHAWLVDGLPRRNGLDLTLAEFAPSSLGFWRLFVWTPTPPPPSGYLGLVFSAVAVVGAVAASRAKAGRLFIVLALLVLAFSDGGFVSRRNLLLLPAALLPLFARGFAALVANAPRVAIAAAALLAIDLGVGSLWSPYRADLEPFGRALAEEAGRQGVGRTLLVSCGSDGVCEAGEWQVGYEAPLRTLMGGFREGAPDTYAPVGSLMRRAARTPYDAAGRERDDETLRSLGVTSIRRLAARSMEPADPAVAARMLPAPTVLFAREVAEGQPAELHPTEPLAVLEDRPEGPTRTVRAQVPGAGWVRIAAAWVRGLRATVDGRSVVPIEDSLGLVVVPVERAGETTLVLEYPTSTRYLWGPIAAVAICGGLAFRGRRRRT